jgi:Putative prokaryotic signal transducing protein
MRKVYTAESAIEVAHLRNVLISAGIPCVVRNDRLGGALGEIPFMECWPELWVNRPGDVLQARGIIENALRAGNTGSVWQCAACGEWMEPQFAECWQCAAEKEARVNDVVDD